MEDYINIINYRVNNRIRSREVRVIDQNGTQLGVLDIKTALAKAAQAELDLVEVSPNATPPVVKILNYGKFKYDQQQKEKENRKKNPHHEVKEVRFRVNIETHDLATKTKQATKFLTQGHKVKAIVQLKGREQAHPGQAEKILTTLISDVKDVAAPEQAVKKEGRNFTVTLLPSN